MHKRSMLNRRAESAVISSVILVAAVIAMGIAVLLYANSRSNIFAQEYSQAVNDDIIKLNEGIAYENIIYYSGTKTLSLYLINYGAANDVEIADVYLFNSTWTNETTDFQLRYFNDTETSDLGIGEEGYVLLESQTLTRGTVYTVKITTERGSTFGKEFVP